MSISLCLFLYEYVYVYIINIDFLNKKCNNYSFFFFSITETTTCNINYIGYLEAVTWATSNTQTPLFRGKKLIDKSRRYTWLSLQYLLINIHIAELFSDKVFFFLFSNGLQNSLLLGVSTCTIEKSLILLVW
jgi:hypothetical protein